MRRITITLVAIALGLLVAFAVFTQNRPAGPAQPGDGERAPGTERQPEQTDAGPTAPPVEQDRAPDAARDEAEPTAPPTVEAHDVADAAIETIAGLQVLAADRPAKVVIGGDEPGGPFRMRVELTNWYAGVERITLADYQQRVDSEEPYVMARRIQVGPRTGTFPYAARSVTVNGQRLNLHGVVTQAGEPKPLWSLVESSDRHASYRLTVADGQGEPVLEIHRTYRLGEDSYDLRLDQRAVNLSDRPLRIQWMQNIQGDLTFDRASYLGDRRAFVAGYFPVANGRRYDVINIDGGMAWHSDLVSDADPQVWPAPGLGDNLLAWLAAENRYFTIVTHPDVPSDLTSTSAVPPLERRFPRVGVTVLSPDVPNPSPSDRAVVLTLGTDEMDLPAGEAVSFDLGVYAGPRQSEIFNQPPYAALHLNELVRYELGCTLCTFQWLAKGLLAFLKGIHWVFADWGVAIILLVLVVRLLLHPITKRAQVNMQKMSKQMQTLQPEIEKLRKKYADDQSKLNQEMMKLYREKGVNPIGMLGCLPMFLQMPIWIALYAMLYFAIELRHEPAFYDVFNHIGNTLGFNWYFLHDLSRADNFIRFFPPGDPGWTLTWVPFISPTFAGINLLPLLMAVVFFFQQKLTMPPPTNDQAAQQQRMMRIMVLIFPFLLYSAPSGLTLYILASTFGGIVDSYIVRKHVREQEAAGTLFQKKERKPGSVMDRISKRMEAKQQELQQRMAQQQQGGGGKSRKKKSR